MKRFLPSARAVCLVVGAFALAACQPPSRRLLLVDLALSDPLLLDGSAAPWRAAGYHVEYRRYYPHLTHDDLARYRTVIVLGGSEPEQPSDALTLGDLAVLTEWIRRGGVVVMGYTSGSSPSSIAAAAGAAGSLDRWIMNRWLAALGTGITIGNRPLQEIGRRGVTPVAVPLPRSALDNAGFAPFPTGQSHALEVRSTRQVLARATSGAFIRPSAGPPTARARAPVVAASRGQDGRGLVVVVSRQALAAAGFPAQAGTGAYAELARTAEFLEALARWTRRPAEWAGIAPASDRGAGLALTVRGAPRPVALDPPARAAPAGAPATPLPGAATTEPRPQPPAWISRQGMRVLWTAAPPRGLDSLLAFTDAAGINALATVVPASALAESLAPARQGGMRIGPRSAWQLTAERLQATSLRWFPAIAPTTIPSAGADEVDRHGDLAAVPCALDSVFWRDALRPALRTLARLGGAGPDVITGIALDLTPIADGYGGLGFCDADYRVGLAALSQTVDSTQHAALAALPPVARYQTLLRLGLLDPYYAALEAAVAERAAALRAELRRLHPELRFAFRGPGGPGEAGAAAADWLSLGLMRGFSTRELPVFLWLNGGAAGGGGGGRALLTRYRRRGIWAVSAIGLDPRRLPLGAWRRLGPLVFGEHDGFWLSAASADTVSRLIRRLVR